VIVRVTSEPRRTHQRTVRARPRPARPFLEPAVHVGTPRGASASSQLVPRPLGPSTRFQARVRGPRTSSTNRGPESGPAETRRHTQDRALTPKGSRTNHEHASKPRGARQRRPSAARQRPEGRIRTSSGWLRAPWEPPKERPPRREAPRSFLAGHQLSRKHPRWNIRTPSGQGELRGAGHDRSGTHPPTMESHTP
jgi:hypothetical protein